MSPVDKPIISLSLNSIIQASVQTIQFLSVQTSTCSQVSVFGGAILFRLGIQLFSQMFKSMKNRQIIEQKYETKIQNVLQVNNNKRFITRWIDKIFIIDMIRDYRFNDIQENILKNDIKNYYTPNQILGSLSTSYLLLNFLRGGYRIIIQEQFSSFNLNTIYLPSLQSHDPNFYLPIIGMLLTYHLIRKSTHPYLLNMRRPQNKIFCFNLGFMVGLCMVPISGIYQFSYLGMIIGHCIIRFFRKLYSPLKYKMINKMWK